MKTRVAMFRGDKEVTQLEHIFRLLGTPTGDLLAIYKQYPDWEKLNLNKNFSSELRSKFLPVFEESSRGAQATNQYSLLTIAQNAVNLLERLLDLNPSTRLTALEALSHPFFTAGGAVLPAEE